MSRACRAYRPYLLLLCVLIAGALTACNNATENLTNKDSRGVCVVIYGDSLTAGYQIDPLKAFPGRLAAKHDVTIVAEGMVGATTQDGLTYFAEKVPRHNPFLVVLEFGGNDVTHRVPKERTFANMGALVREVHQLGAAAIIVAVKADLVGDTYGTAYEKIAEENGAGVVTGFLNDVIARPQFMLDPIHPNEEGHAFLAERLNAVLAPILRQMPAAQAARGAET